MTLSASPLAGEEFLEKSCVTPVQTRSGLPRTARKVCRLARQKRVSAIERAPGVESWTGVSGFAAAPG